MGNSNKPKKEIVVTGPLSVRKVEEQRPEAKAVITIIKHKTVPEGEEAALIRLWSSLPRVQPLFPDASAPNRIFGPKKIPNAAKPSVELSQELQAKFELSGKKISKSQEKVTTKIKAADTAAKVVLDRFTRTHNDFAAFHNVCRSIPTMISGIAAVKGRLALTLSQLAHIENNFSDLFNHFEST